MSNDFNNQQSKTDATSGDGLDSSWNILEKPEVTWRNLGQEEKTPEPPTAQGNINLQPKIEAKVPIQPIPEIPKPSTEIAQQPKKIWQILKFAGVIVGVFLFIYAFLTFPALLSKATYWWQKNIAKTKPQTQKIIPETVNNDVLFLSTVTYYSPPEKLQTEKLPTKASLGVTNLGNNELWIPKLEKKAPIVWDSPVDEDTMQQNLKSGVVHYKGTTKPDEKAENGAGNVFISGHSSYYWWDDGKYKTIFANLDQMQADDQVAIGYGDKTYIYKVVDKKEVNPNDVSVLDQNTQNPTLSLMTCVPVGTNLRRLIIKAELVAVGSDSWPTTQPVPTTTTTIPTIQPKPTTLPNIDTINLLPWRW